MRGITFKDKSYVIYYYVSGFLEDEKSEESKKVMYALEISQIISLKLAPSFPDPKAEVLAKRS